MKKFDIIVHEMDPKAAPYPENGVMAPDAKTLAKVYADCEQRIEIVREYEDDDCKNYGKQKDIDVSNVRLEQGQCGSGGGLMTMNPHLEEFLKQHKTEVDKTTENKPQDVQTENQPSKQAVPQTPVQKSISEPPRFFEVGGIKCKMENGELWQKQWMRLTEDEASEFRLVSDKNNKICPIKEKHIEVMKWVKVENENKNDGNRQLLNG